MIRPSDQRPGKPRPPRTKQGRASTPPPSGGGAKTSWWPCSIVIAVPALTALAACTLLIQHGP